jgi:hypothetical protein
MVGATNGDLAGLFEVTRCAIADAGISASTLSL